MKRPNEARTRPLSWASWKSAAGWMAAVGSERGLRYLTLPRPEKAQVISEVTGVFPSLLGTAETPEVFGDLRSDLEAYFAGEKIDLSKHRVDLDLTDFQRKVLEACAAIPRGQTKTYGELAAEVGHPGAARAVGQVMATNPVSLVFP